MRLLNSFVFPFYLALQNMRSRKGRTLLTLVGIVLGVAVVLAIRITNQSTLDSIQQVFDRASGKADLMVVSSNQGVKRLPQGLLTRISRLDHVQVAAPTVKINTLLAQDASGWQIAFTMNGIASGNLLMLYGVDPEIDGQVRVYQFLAGRLPSMGEYEVVIPEKLAADKDLRLGRNMAILTPQGVTKLEIVGLLADEGVAMLNDGVLAIAPLDVVQEIFNLGSDLDEIAIRTSEGVANQPQELERVKQELEKRVGSEGEAIYPAARGQLVSQMMATYQLGLTFFSLIAVFVGAFLIYNTFSMTIVERTREIGMLRAIGMTRWHILGMVLAEAGLLSIIGSLLGIGAGILLARGLMALVGQVIISIEGFGSIPWQGLAQSLAVGIGVTLSAALIPAAQAARIAPVTAMRIRSRSREPVRPTVWLSGIALLFIGWAVLYRIEWRQVYLFPIGTSAVLLILLGATLTVTLAASPLERLARPIARAIYHAEGALGSANIRRSISRTTLTIAALMVALTMIISINSLAYSFEQDMTSWIINALGGDLYVRSPIPMRESFGAQLANIPGVAGVTPVRLIEVRTSSQTPPVQTDDNRLYYTALDPQTYRQVGGMEFAADQGDPEKNWRDLLNGNAVFISNVVADRFKLNKGDHIVLLTGRGERAFRIAGVVMDFSGQGHSIYGTYMDLHRWFGEKGVDRFTIKVRSGYPVQEVADEIKDRFGTRRHLSLQTTESFKQNILDLMNESFQLFDVLSLIGVIIGALGVINTLVMNVLERQREIGGLRSLGMTRGQVMRMVVAEAFTLGVMGGVYGLGFGTIIAQVMIMGTNMMIGYDLDYLFTARPYIISALIALVIVQVSSLYPARRAANVNIVEAIKHE